MVACDVCFRHCDIAEGAYGLCGVRTCKDGRIVYEGYGRITGIALDPIEKKPLSRFMPGSMILSAGSYGCNLRCPFCQNHDISWSERAYRYATEAELMMPEELADIAYGLKERGNVGLAYTYNEPLIGYEFVLDTARLIHDKGMVNVMVTNGTAELMILEKLAPFIDAMNIDLKGFTERYYRDVLKGDLDMVKDFIRHAARTCHVELTTLIIPGENDTEDEMSDIAEFIASVEADTGKEIALHISRFFPQFHMTDRDATDVGLIYRLAEVARHKIRYVYTGNC